MHLSFPLIHKLKDPWNAPPRLFIGMSNYFRPAGEGGKNCEQSGNGRHRGGGIPIFLMACSRSDGVRDFYFGDGIT